jgi:hypothetical protein
MNGVNVVSLPSGFLEGEKEIVKLIRNVADDLEAGRLASVTVCAIDHKGDVFEIRSGSMNPQRDAGILMSMAMMRLGYTAGG